MEQITTATPGPEAPQERFSRIWASAMECLQEQAWAEAEGLLWRLWQLEATPPWELCDALGFCLLQQGCYDLCETVLRPALTQAGCSFWVSHKLGDALLGQNRLAEAARWYQEAERSGSDSPLTARNLMQALYPTNPQECLRILQRWHQQASTPDAFWEGVREAALVLPSLDLAEWLWNHHRGDGACRRRLLEARCLALDVPGCWRLLASSPAWGAWETALAQRLQQLGLGQQLQTQALAHDGGDAIGG